MSASAPSELDRRADVLDASGVALADAFARSELDLGEWPGALSLRTYSGKSVYFLVARAVLLLTLSIYAGLHGSTTLLTLAVTAFAIDIAHTVLQAYVQIRGLDLQRFLKRLVVGDLDQTVAVSGNDEIAMYARVLEALRQSMLRSRALEAAERTLSEELRRNNERLRSTLNELRATQDRIVSQQKLAELGELSAGVAHEIRNPLQFIKHFAESSVALAAEIGELLADTERLASEEARGDIAEVSSDLTENMTRIVSHSDRANRIVSDMLSLGRDTVRELRPADINRLVVEQAMLAFHAACVRHPGFNVDIEQDLDSSIGELAVVPVDLGRVFINIVANACYAIEAKRDAGVDFAPHLRLATRRLPEGVEIRIRDNGTGMSPEVMERMFTPFYTTKSGTHGTGLGMSLSHDIVRLHGGTLTPVSVEGEYTEMTVWLPEHAAQADG